MLIVAGRNKKATPQIRSRITSRGPPHATLLLCLQLAFDHIVLVIIGDHCPKVSEMRMPASRCLFC